MAAPAIVARESAVRARPARGSLLSFNSPAWLLTPTRVPAVSKRSTNKKAKITVNKPISRAPAISIFKKVGAMLGGAEKIPFGAATAPEMTPTRAVTTIPIKTAPLTRRIMSSTVTTKPNRVRRISFCIKSGLRATKVASDPMMICAFFRPIKAINKPIPAETACFMPAGITLMIVSRMRVAVKSRKITPEMKTAPSAVCHGTPMPCTTVYVKYAFNPIPGARAIG